MVFEIVPTTWEYVNRFTLANFNDPTRIEERFLSDLIKRMENLGYDPNWPIHATRDFFVGDGHRRVTVARMLNIDKITAKIFQDKVGTVGAQQLWTEAQWGKSSMKSNHTIYAVNAGLNPDYLPPNRKKAIDDINRIDPNLLSILADHKLSRYAITTAQNISRFCGYGSYSNFTREAILWVVEYGTSKTSKLYGQFKDYDFDPERLEEVVLSRIDPEEERLAIKNYYF